MISLDICVDFSEGSLRTVSQNGTGKKTLGKKVSGFPLSFMKAFYLSCKPKWWRVLGRTHY